MNQTFTNKDEFFERLAKEGLKRARFDELEQLKAE